MPFTPATHALPIARNAPGADIDSVIGYICMYGSGSGAVPQGALWPKRESGCAPAGTIGGAGCNLSTVFSERGRACLLSGVPSSPDPSLGMSSVTAGCDLRSRGAATGAGAPLSLLWLDGSNGGGDGRSSLSSSSE
jgi:hypothetical protein